MRRSRLATGAVATLATLALLVANPVPSSADPEPADMGVQQTTQVVISQVQSRAQQAGNTQAEIQNNGNALEIANPTPNALDISGWTVDVFNAAGNVTAQFTFPGGTMLPSRGFVLLRDMDFFPTPRDPRLTQIFTLTSLFGTDEIPDQFGAELRDTTGNRVDSVATVTGIPGFVVEGAPALALSAATDPFNASIRRDVIQTDSNNNRFDFQRRPAGWGSVVAG